MRHDQREMDEAALYDWHNMHRLKAQRDDISYWMRVAGRADRLLVLGAGTGRVAVPLAERPSDQGGSGAPVTAAIDSSIARLRRVPATPSLVVVQADMRRLPLAPGFDAAIIPYSTLQLLPTAGERELALAETARVLQTGALLHIDVSGSFDLRGAADWHVILRAPCNELERTVVEWERCTPHSGYVVIEKSFRTSDDEPLLDVQEHWVHLQALDLEPALAKAGFDLVTVDHGYGMSSSAHRRIYRSRRR